MLVQFAHMGACFAEDVLGRRAPRVGLLSIGEEPGKGNQLTKEVFELLAGRARSRLRRATSRAATCSLNKVQVVVTDAFTGNVALKTAEGTAIEVFKLVKATANRNPMTKVGGLLLRSGVRDLRTRLDPETYGGAFLLGLAGHLGRGARLVVAGRDRQRLPDGGGGRAARRLRPRRGPRRARGGPRRRRLRRLATSRLGHSCPVACPPGPLSATFGALD